MINKTILPFKQLCADGLYAVLIVAILLQGLPGNFNSGITKAEASEPSGNTTGNLLTEPDQEPVTVRSIDSWKVIPQNIFGVQNSQNIKPENITVANAVGLVASVSSRNVVIEEFPGRQFENPERISQHPVSLHQERDVFLQLQFQDQVFWQYTRPVLASFRFGNYVVFVEKESQNKKNITLNFIDLDFFSSALGKPSGALGIFQVPVQLDRPLDSISIQNGKLHLNEQALSEDVFDYFTFLQGQTWNVQANLLSSSTYSDLEPLIDSIWESFDLAQDQASEKLLGDLTSIGFDKSKQELAKQNLKARLQAAKQKANSDSTSAMELTSEIVASEFAESEDSKKRIQETLKLHTSSRKLLGRINLMWNRLQMPQPMAGHTFREAISFVVSGLKGPMGENAWQLKEGALGLAHHTGVRLTSAIAGGLIIGQMAPDATIEFVSHILNLGSTVVEQIANFGIQMATLAKEAVSSSGLFNPQQIWDAYIAKGPFNDFLVANQVLITKLLQTFGITHLTVNTANLIRELSSGEELHKSKIMTAYKAARESGKGWFSSVFWAAESTGLSDLKDLLIAVKNDFVTRQSTERDRYLKAQGEGLGNADNIKFTPEQDALAIKMVEERVQLDRSPIMKLVDKVKTAFTPKSWSKKSSFEIQSFGGALSNFLFSWNSLEHTYRFLTPIWWKFLFLSRSFIPWRPFTAMGLLYFPEAFNVATKFGMGGRSVRLTDANGGKRTFWKHWNMRFHTWFGKGPYKEFKNWENKIIPIEEMFLREAEKRALRETLKRSVRGKTAQDISAMASSKQTVGSLSRENQVFYQRSLDLLFKKSFDVFLSELKENCSSQDFCVSDLDRLKMETSEAIANVVMTEPKVSAIMDQVEDESVYKQAELKPVPEAGFLSRRMLSALKKSLDPSTNAQIKRWLVVDEQMTDAGALSRSTRKAFFGMLGKIPELFITWAAVSGIMLSALNGETPMSDMMVPLKPEYPYYSPYLFSAGFFTSVVISMMSNFGYNLQVEYRLKKTGLFEKVPTGPDAERSFLSWFWKQFNDKENTYFKNHLDILKIVWANIPAATTMYIITYGLTMGYFPLDVFLLGYLMYIITPTAGFDMKVDQAFEAASAGFWAKHFPPELRSHPVVQEYFLKKKGRARAVFQVIFTFFYTNMVNALIKNMQLMAVESSRTLARILFFGHPPTVWALEGLQNVKEVVKVIPGAEEAITACQKALSINYDGWDPKIDGPPPDWIEPWESKK